jgi:hypothetical protein
LPPVWGISLSGIAETFVRFLVGEGFCSVFAPQSSAAACAMSTILGPTSLLQVAAVLKALAAVGKALFCSAAKGIFSAFLLFFSERRETASSVLTASPL